jgi:hypothetical protein
VKSTKTDRQTDRPLARKIRKSKAFEGYQTGGVYCWQKEETAIKKSTMFYNVLVQVQALLLPPS